MFFCQIGTKWYLFTAIIHALLRPINEEITIGTSERNEYESKQWSKVGKQGFALLWNQHTFTESQVASNDRANSAHLLKRCERTFLQQSRNDSDDLDEVIRQFFHA